MVITLCSVLQLLIEKVDQNYRYLLNVSHRLIFCTGIYMQLITYFFFLWCFQNFAGDKDTLGKCEQVYPQLSSCA
jgi:hypothetical protein